MLVGLFFSNAEGLRLLPFPEAWAPQQSAGTSGSDEVLSHYHPGAAGSTRTQKTSVKKSRETDPSGSSTPQLALLLHVEHFRSTASIVIRRIAFSSSFLQIDAPLRGPPSARPA